MTQTELNEALVRICEKDPPDLEEVKALLLAGADPNLTDERGESIFNTNNLFLEALYRCQGTPVETEKTAEQVKDVIRTMVAVGWDSKRFGQDTMDQFIFSTYDRFTFEMYRFMLQYELATTLEEYDYSLELIATEESFQRCSMEDPAMENLFYAIFEMVEAKMKGRDYRSIGLYDEAPGLRIDRIVYLSDTDTTRKRDSFVEFDADIGFVCGDKLLVLREGINILFMNDRLAESPHLEMPLLFGENIIGYTITDVSFSHRSVSNHGQPTIILSLDNGKLLKFTHNFGECPDKNYQCRFWVE